MADQQAAQQQPTREQVREQVREALRGVDDGMRDANRLQGPRAPLPPGLPGGISIERSGSRQVITLPNGKRIEINGDRIAIDGQTFTTVPDLRNVVPQGAVAIVEALGTTLVFCVVGFPLARAFARMLDRRGAAPKVSADVMTRLGSIENAVESVAVEVERISEGQRFTTKLLSDRVQRDPAQPVAAGDRAIG